jgi:uncharacterized membrane protein YphA (DoxX/SURF4 family)
MSRLHTTMGIVQGLQTTRAERLSVAFRLIAGVPLLAIGLAHVFEPSAPMAPLVEAAGLPAVSVLSPVAVAIEIAAGIMLMAGFYARLGAALAIPAMAVAVYAHIVIDVWPNGAENEPPIVLPLAVMACAAYVLKVGAGRWSIDRLMSRSRR